VIEAVSKSGVEAIAVTDRNEIGGAMRAAEMAPFPIIAGQEIASQ
jgi:predicted metal-dependent phosphoesterase TrpH